jgi:hypothetical protein
LQILDFIGSGDLEEIGFAVRPFNLKPDRLS